MRVLVLPDPGGARIWRTAAGEVTAVRWAGLRPPKILSIDIRNKAGKLNGENGRREMHTLETRGQVTLLLT